PPVVQTQTAPFDDDFFSSQPVPAMDVPSVSVEIPLPQGIVDSLPELDTHTASSVAAPQRRSSDGFVKEVSIPLNLSMSELREHRRLRLKITIDVNLLP